VKSKKRSCPVIPIISARLFWILRSLGDNGFHEEGLRPAGYTEFGRRMKKDSWETEVM
jgi:hypothetical protein